MAGKHLNRYQNGFARYVPKYERTANDYLRSRLTYASAAPVLVFTVNTIGSHGEALLRTSSAVYPEIDIKEYLVLALRYAVKLGEALPVHFTFERRGKGSKGLWNRLRDVPIPERKSYKQSLWHAFKAEGVQDSFNRHIVVLCDFLKGLTCVIATLDGPRLQPLHHRPSPTMSWVDHNLRLAACRVPAESQVVLIVEFIGFLLYLFSPTELIVFPDRGVAFSARCGKIRQKSLKGRQRP